MTGELVRAVPRVLARAANDPSVSPTSAFIFKTLLRHYAKQAPKHVKLGSRWDKGWGALRIYANQPAHP